MFKLIISIKGCLLSIHILLRITKEKISAVLPKKEFKTIMEELEDLEDIRLYDESKRDNKPAISRTEAMKMIEAQRKKLANSVQNRI